MIKPDIIETIRAKYQVIEPELDERARRIWAATEATSLGHGGVVTVAKATGLAESTIRIGRRELKDFTPGNNDPAKRRIRRTGGGRKRLEQDDDRLLQLLDSLVEPTSRGAPMSPLRWTCKSTRRLAKELTARGHKISHAKVGKLLDELGHSLQSTRKTMEGKTHPDRNSQFEFINNKVRDYQLRCQPTISVDAKKKELIGRFANSGREYQPKGKPEVSETYDFPSIAEGKGIPYGVFDITKNLGRVSVGSDHDTAQFAVHTIRQWWYQMGRHVYPHAEELLITTDDGGSNSGRSRLWKYELQRFVDETHLSVSVCHFPPGTSKWNKIEHRMLSYITKNWRGKPLISHEVIVNLIANTTTEAGLEIQAGLDRSAYPIGTKISDKEMAALNLEKNKFHGEWNYTLRSRQNR